MEVHSPENTTHGWTVRSRSEIPKSSALQIVAPHSRQYSELQMLLAEDEVAMSSRNIGPLQTTDADHYLTLTPGHFLIGRPQLALHSHLASQANLSYLRRWQLVQRLAKNFWIAWKSQYLQ